MSKENEAYAILQAEWFRTHPVGTKVIILRTAQTHECGWGNSWEPEMSEKIGKTVTITGVDSSAVYNGGVYFNEIGLGCPFFVLGDVKQSALKLEDLPYEVRRAAWEKWRNIEKRGYFSRLNDWSQSNCSVCQHIQKKLGVGSVSIENCEKNCPLFAEGYCTNNGGKLYHMSGGISSEEWLGNVKAFLSWIWPGFQVGDYAKIVKPTHYYCEDKVGKIYRIEKLEMISDHIYMVNGGNWADCDCLELSSEEEYQEQQEPQKPQLSDLPRDVRIKAWLKWHKIYEKKTFNQYSPDWSAQDCSICQHLKQKYNVTDIGTKFCTEHCPLVADGWCNCGHSGSKLFKHPYESTENWLRNVERFLNWIKPEFEVGDRVKVVKATLYGTNESIGKTLKILEKSDRGNFLLADCLYHGPEGIEFVEGEVKPTSTSSGTPDNTQLKEGDKVRVLFAKYGTPESSVGKVLEVTGPGCVTNSVRLSDGFHYGKEQLEKVVNPAKFRKGDRVRVVDPESPEDGEEFEITQVSSVGNGYSTEGLHWHQPEHLEMVQPRFEIGDKVRIVRGPTKDTYTGIYTIDRIDCTQASLDELPVGLKWHMFDKLERV